MMCWAMARLAYMPAATLVRATLPLIANWRSPAVQVCAAYELLDWLDFPHS